MKNHFRRLVAISIVGMCFNAILNANVGILSQFSAQNDNEWIGPLSIALNFLGSGLGALYNGYIGKYPYSRIIFVGGMGWNVFCSFSVIFLFFGFKDYINGLIVAGSFICGIVASMFYSGVFNYVNECGRRDRQSNRYFGINMCLFQTANLLGNALSAVMIEPLGQKVYSCVMLGLGIVICSTYLGFPSFNQNKKQHSLEPEKAEALLSREEEPSQRESVQSEHPQNQNKKKVPLALFFSFALTGIIISFVYGEFSILFFKYYNQMSKEQLNSLTFLTFMIEGCGEFIGGLLVIVFSKKFSNLPLVYTLNGLCFLGAIVLVFFGFENDNKSLLYFSAFLVGICDCLCFSLALVMAGIWHQSGLSLFILAQTGTVGVLSILHIFLDLPYLCIIYVGFLVLSTVFVFKYRNQLRESKQNQPQIPNIEPSLNA